MALRTSMQLFYLVEALHYHPPAGGMQRALQEDVSRCLGPYITGGQVGVDLFNLDGPFRELAEGGSILPITASIAPFGIVTGVLIATTGKYRAFHFVGCIILTTASGLFSLLDDKSPARDWASFQVLFGAGSGMIFSSTLPPTQVSLPESDVATATATRAFMRSFGCIWGIAIPTTIFHARVQELPYQVSDAYLRKQLCGGGAYAMTSEGLMRTLRNTPQPMAEVLGIYQESLRWVW
ncbi:hypothetical protein N8T08_008134 [Aspergillus melleus]|uniref:Uncharacterized protein n=1 Tax=Aspergillus melleus TaxID=138277 RepID=A0ACC3AWJ8_9EURO|nr:hypothetical protein N8T08_008134 [Aspergillus melleus]